MKNGELIELLSKLPPDVIVQLQYYDEYADAVAIQIETISYDSKKDRIILT